MRIRCLIAALVMTLVIAAPVFATAACPPSSPWPPASGPIVKTVPWVVPQAPTCLIVPHDTISGATIYLKATTDATAVQYYWDFGDGTSTAWTNVSDRFNIGSNMCTRGRAADRSLPRFM